MNEPGPPKPKKKLHYKTRINIAIWLMLFILFGIAIFSPFIIPVALPCWALQRMVINWQNNRHLRWDKKQMIKFINET